VTVLRFFGASSIQKRKRKMKGHLLHLVSEAQAAFNEMTSVADKLAAYVKEEDANLVHRKVSLAKSQGNSALDKLRNMLEAKEVT
jgi:hypothetical protein